MLIHNRQFACEYCDFNLKSEDALLKHIRSKTCATSFKQNLNFSFKKSAGGRGGGGGGGGG